MYSELPKDGEAQQRPITGAHLLKAGVALGAGSCLLLLIVAALSASTPAPHGAGAQEPTSLLALPSTALRSPSVAAGPSSVLPMGSLLRGPAGLSSLPGPSPWKELALTAMEGAVGCSRDVSAAAQQSRLQDVVASMDGRSRAMVHAATETAVNKVKEMAGITAPLGFWDPLGIATNLPQGRLLFYREVELKHGRVCMLAALGILVAEKFHPLFGGDIDLPAYIAFQQTPLEKFWIAVAAVIAIPEFSSISSYKEPTDIEGKYKDGFTFTMKEDRVPGDLGFDPLKLKPKDAKGFLSMQNKEINNGRLAMMAVAGMIGQELATGQKLL